VRYTLIAPSTEWTFSVSYGKEMGSDVEIQKKVIGGGEFRTPAGTHVDPWGGCF
jgi:hypothetical protein